MKRKTDEQKVLDAVAPLMKKKRISAWLGELDGHQAIHVEAAKIAFEKETGLPWPKHLAGRPVKELLAEGKKDFKGLQVWNGPADAHVCGAWILASSLASIYVPDFSAMSIGRGSAFREYVEALRKAGH